MASSKNRKPPLLARVGVIEEVGLRHGLHQVLIRVGETRLRVEVDEETAKKAAPCLYETVEVTVRRCSKNTSQSIAPPNTMTSTVLRLGVTAKEIAQLDIGDCATEEYPCVCAVCAFWEALTCTCGCSYVDHSTNEEGPCAKCSCKKFVLASFETPQTSGPTHILV